MQSGLDALACPVRHDTYDSDANNVKEASIKSLQLPRDVKTYQKIKIQLVGSVPPKGGDTNGECVRSL